MVRGIVMCGGQSTRMRSDKGLMKFHSQYWVEIAYQKLNSLNIPVSISINTTQLKNYSQFLPQYNYIVDNKKFDVKGPLIGIISAHLKFPKDDLLILATDMLLLKKETLNYIIQLNLNNSKDVTLYQTDQYLQPLCAIYTKNALDTIIQQVLSDEIKHYSLKSIIQSLNTEFVQSEITSEFQNFNTIEEFKNLL
ncbi:molybdenum cofactor guanylyltransferase [Rhizosphaericola mali]|uniref:Molybdenum cofactor guanylyltransferase n=1 Tax=Rhizosphaericola mali TaxID=2545455 RepID=A0A5P2FYW5_9BACT|nr:molybdenum cofactor guanylyltransferase [Rhizosphaericola mali]QES88395.1 molybdenum cofactor guanylyltransferase [Rhizosphaericola mali]